MMPCVCVCFCSCVTNYQCDILFLKKQDTDESTHSLVLALNDDYTGGGTYFYDHDTIVRLEQGQVLSFAGGELSHGGEAVTAGRRYILAIFLYHDGDDEKNTCTQSSLHTASSTRDARNCEAGQRKRNGTTGISSISKGFRDCKQQKTNAFSFGFAVDK